MNPSHSVASRTTNRGKERSDHDNPALKDKRVLIVEDETDTREMLAHALKQRGAKPIEADSAKQAFCLLEKQGYDLVISDIGMPEVDGYTFMRKMRSMKSPARKLPAIALTAYAGEEDRKLAMQAGFDAHVPKPVTLTELVRVIGKVIGQPRKLTA